MVNIKSALRTVQPAAELETVTVTDIAKETGAVDVRMVQHTASGNTYVHFVNANEQYLSVKVGKKCNVSGDTPAQLKQLINNFLIYTGVNEDGIQWFTFGPKADTTPTKVVSLASLLGKQQLEGVK